MPDRPLTILQLTHQGEGAGSTQSILSLSIQLAWRGHRVLVGCRSGTLLARRAAEAGLADVSLDFGRLRRLACGLRDAIAREHVDVVNSHATRDRRALMWLRWLGRLPQAFVVTRRTMPLTSPLEIGAVHRTADRTIAVSRAVADALVRRWCPVGRVRIVPNGIDLARVDAPVGDADLAAARAALGERGGRAVVVVVARRKDQPVLLRELRAVRPPVLLAFVGIEQDAELRALERELPDRHRVAYVPFTERPLAFYHLADVAALPSRIEGLSQTLLEAMALGLPVVASGMGGNPELVTDHETGLLVPRGAETVWATAIETLLEHRDLARRLGAAGRALVRQEFTIARTAERTEAVYREAVASR